MSELHALWFTVGCLTGTAGMLLFLFVRLSARVAALEAKTGSAA